MTGIIDYGIYLCVAALALAFVVWGPALERRIKGDTKPHPADKYIIIQSLLFILSFLAYLAFNLSNLFPSGNLLPASISNEWLFFLGTGLIVLGVLIFFPISYVVWSPKWPIRIREKIAKYNILKKSNDPGFRLVVLTTVVLMQFFYLVALAGDIQAFIQFHAPFTVLNTTFFITLILSFVGVVPIFRGLYKRPRKAVHGWDWAYLTFFLLPYAIVVTLSIYYVLHL